MYTSGSTGAPKGVSVPHRAVVRLVKNTNYARLTADEVFLQLAPLAFDASTFEIWGSLLNGARLAIAPPGVPPVDELGRTLRRHRVSTLWLTAALFHEVVEQDIDSLEAVRQLLAGGDVLSVAHVKRVLRERPGCRLINGYGPTETTTFACCFPLSDADEVGSSVPIGRPIANTRVYVLDRHRESVPIGVPGELYIGGDGLARGYLNHPELTAERFVPDPFGNRPDGRLYQTGDVVRYRADGNLEFLGRVDHQVKIRGFRVEPGEIEATLGQHTAVREAVVVARADSPGAKCLVAYLVPRTEPGPSPADLRQYLAERLPAYMIPSAFVQLPALPLTPSGKVDRRALPGPSRSDLVMEPDAVRARDAVEARLVKIWEDVLRVRPIGATDDFFQLGGHSLLATQLVARIEQAFGKRIPLTALFLTPTIAQLAPALRDEAAAAPWPRVVPIQPDGRRPPFFFVDAWALFRPLAQHLGCDQPFLGLSLDVGALPTPFKLEDVAAYHVETIRTVQARGPYFLGGWSAGGVVAYEIAQQLSAQGEDVALVALFDAVMPAQFASLSPLRSTQARLRLLTQKLGFHCRHLCRGSLREAPGYLHDRLKTIREDLEERAWRIRYALRLMRRRPIEAGLRDPHQINVFTYRTYRPRPYPSRVVLFRRSDRRHYSDPAAGWRPLLGDRLEIHEAHGDHMTMFSDPHVELLARALRGCLDTSQGAPATNGERAGIPD
jgi:aspartate racemase